MMWLAHLVGEARKQSSVEERQVSRAMSETVNAEAIHFEAVCSEIRLHIFMMSRPGVTISLFVAWCYHHYSKCGHPEQQEIGVGTFFHMKSVTEHEDRLQEGTMVS